MQNVISFLSGKKTYFLIGVAFVYGGLIQIGVCHHSPQFDLLLAGGTIAALRAGISKSTVIISSAPNPAGETPASTTTR